MKHLVADQTSVIRQLRDRVRTLERANPGNERPRDLEVAVFSAGHDVAPPVATSPSYKAVSGGQVTQVNVTLVAAGSTATTYQLKVDGALVGATFSMASGETDESFYVGNVRVPARARLQVVCSAAGTGALGPVVQVVMR